jgi:hypothetical protein
LAGHCGLNHVENLLEPIIRKIKLNFHPHQMISKNAVAPNHEFLIHTQPKYLMKRLDEL